MTEDAKQAWSEVGERFSSWGRRVAEHYEEAGPTRDAAADEAERELRRAAKELMDILSRGVTAVGATIRDDQAGKQLGEAFSSMGDAITATVNEATDGIRSGKKGPPPPPPA